MKASLAVLFLGLVACTGPKVESPPPEDSPDPTVFDPLTGTLDRAAGVEDTLREGEARRRRAIEEAEGL